MNDETDIVSLVICCVKGEIKEKRLVMMGDALYKQVNTTLALSYGFTKHERVELIKLLKKMSEQEINRLIPQLDMIEPVGKHNKAQPCYVEPKSLSRVLYERRKRDPEFNTNQYKRLINLFDRLFDECGLDKTKGNEVFELVSKYYTDED